MLRHVGDTDHKLLVEDHPPAAGQPAHPAAQPQIHIANAPVTARPSFAQHLLDIVGHACALLLAVPMSFLPAAWRERAAWSQRLPFVFGTFISAALQGILCIFLLIYFYGGFGSMGHDFLARHFLLVFLTIFYFFFESGARILSALAVREPLPTLPLWLAERGIHWYRRARRRRTPVVDGEPAALPEAKIVQRR